MEVCWAKKIPYKLISQWKNSAFPLNKNPQLIKKSMPKHQKDYKDVVILPSKTNCFEYSKGKTPHLPLFWQLFGLQVGSRMEVLGLLVNVPRKKGLYGCGGVLSAAISEIYRGGNVLN